MDLFHPDAVLPAANSHVVGYGTPQISTLSNGIKVVTTTSPLPVTHITLSIKAGSRFENVELGEAGMTHLLERSILRSSTNRVTGTLFRDMAKLGADLEASAGRETLLIKASSPTRVNPVLGAIADIVKNASYDLVDLRTDMMYYVSDTHRRHGDSDAMLDETLHMAAFGPTPLTEPLADGTVPHFGLGNSLYMSEHALADVTPAKLRKFHAKFLTADRMTIGAVGVEHDSFVALAEEMFGSIHTASDEVKASIPNTQTAYVAGNLRLHDQEHAENTTVSLAWNAPSLLSQHLAATNVLQTLLGGGASFSSGGPGKGMYSRLYRNILQSYDFVQSVDSYYTNYTDAGLFGVVGTVPAGSAGDFAEVILQEMAALPDSINEFEVSRAKNMLRSQLLEHVGDGNEFCDEMTNNVALFGKYQFPHFLEQVEAVTLQDVKNVAAMIIEQDITVVTHGDAADLPREVAM